MASALTRRDFLAHTATVATAMALPRWAMAAQTRMFISLNGAVAPRVGPWPEVAQLASRIGYGGLDWGFGPTKAAGADATKALFTELKLKPTIVNLPTQQPFAGDDAAFKEKLAPLDPPDAWLWNEAGERFGVIVFDEELPESVAWAETLIGKRPEVGEEFDVL